MWPTIDLVFPESIKVSGTWFDQRAESSHLAHVVLLIYHAYKLIAHDYRTFTALGPGGTPSTILGYMKITLLRMISRWNVLEAPPYSSEMKDQPYFTNAVNLVQREGPRPDVRGIAPQRQISQRGEPALVAALNKKLRSIAANNPSTITTGISAFEKHSLALFLAQPSLLLDLEEQLTQRPCPQVKNTTKGSPPELAHYHDIDGSLHVTLHPGDVKTVIEKGWGERHPLAGRWVPSGFVLIYAPRKEEEIDAVVQILKAACFWVSGTDFQA